MSTARLSEKHIHAGIAKYIRMKYPKVIFRTDFAAGIKMSIGQAVRNKELQSSSGFPDLFIAEMNNTHCGLFLEIKNGRDKVFKKDGTLLKNEHIERQAEMLHRLRSKGYMAEFVCSFNEAVEIIDNYLNYE